MVRSQAEGRTMDLKLTRVTSPDQVPEGPHFALLIYTSESVTIPGDERSRTNPGHGYPEHTNDYPTFTHYVTTDIEALRVAIGIIGAEHIKYPYKEIPFTVLKVQGVVKITNTIDLFIP